MRSCRSSPTAHEATERHGHRDDRDADTQAEVFLDTDNLNQLAAEILRIREERGF